MQLPSYLMTWSQKQDYLKFDNPARSLKEIQSMKLTPDQQAEKDKYLGK